MSNADSVCGRWLNQNGSVLVVDAIDDGVVQGHFESKKGRAARGKIYPMLGRHNGELLSFIVDFQGEEANLASMTSFSGRLAHADGVQELHTVWVLSRAFEDAERTKPTQPWNSFLTNSDVFRKVADAS